MFNQKNFRKHLGMEGGEKNNTDSVERILPWLFHLKGKEAFDKEIENSAFERKPEIVVTSMIEENNIVVAEGTVHAKKRNNGVIDLMFCDIFIMENELIDKLTSYLIGKK